MADEPSLYDSAKVWKGVSRRRGMKIYKILRDQGYHPDIIFHSTGETTVIQWINLIFNKNQQQER